MSNDTSDHTDLHRLADDGCPHAYLDAMDHDPSESRTAGGKGCR
jgi:hypothetical protein